MRMRYQIGPARANRQNARAPSGHGEDGGIVADFGRGFGRGLGGGFWRGSGQDRKSVVEGKSVSVRVDVGGRRIIKQKQNKDNRHSTDCYTKTNSYSSLIKHRNQI